jgi:hypothetical protein
VGEGLVEDCEFVEMGCEEGETSDLGRYVSRASVSECRGKASVSEHRGQSELERA